MLTPLGIKPKVILDIAFLGHEHSVQRGAERVAGKIFEGLLASNQCDLSFVATSHLAGVYDFLNARGISPEKLYFHPFQLQASRWGRKISRVIHRSIANRTWPARAKRRVLAQIARSCQAGEANFSKKFLAQADIYHSTLTPFPAAVKNEGRLKKFLTLNDFIPLKNPEFFNESSRPFMDAVIACLTPDNFAFCISETTKNDALNFSRIPPEHVFVTPLAADADLFYPVTDSAKIAAVCAASGIPGQPYFLALSAQDRHKNFPHLIHCFGALIEAGELSDFNLVIVGSNPGRNPEVAAALEKYPRMRQHFIVTGFLPDENLAAIYSGATAFLFPSFAEGFGIPPLEAMQCGTPVIASNTTSMPEVIGDAGILLSPTDNDAWCQMMLKISRDETLRAQLREKSLQRCKLFSWQRFIEEILRGYRASLEIN